MSTDQSVAPETTTSDEITDATDTVVSEIRREGSDAIADSLVASGVEMIFGYTGGSVPALARSLFAEEKLQEFGGRTELTAAWMSYGYNRVKRRAASAVVSWAVGALHVAPAVYGAKLDGTPLLVLVMNNPPAYEARDPLQDAVEVYPSLKPISKYIKKVTDAGDLPVIVRQAVKEASTGRFGPSVLDLAQTAMYQTTNMAVEELHLPHPPAARADDVAAVLELLLKAERPVIYAGAGVHISDGAEELRELAELLGVPVVSTSWGGRGLLPDAHPLYAGASGNFGWRSANDTLQRSDMWLAVGTSFSQMSTGSWSLKKPGTVVHVDVDQREIAKIFQPTLGLAADAKEFLSQLLDLARRKLSGTASNGSGTAAKSVVAADTTAWREEIAGIKAEWLTEMSSWYNGTEVPINQYFLIKTLSDNLPEDTLVVADSGGNAFGMYRAFEYKTVTPLATGGRYMSLGAGLPVAMGAKLADPSRTVVSYHGDGGLYYDFAELSNLTQRNLKIIVIIDNNHCLLANRASAKASGIDNPWVDLPQTTDFVTVAKGMGVDGERVETPDQIVPALQRALAAEGSYVLDVHTEPGLRIMRALSGVIPIVGDRTPKKGHLTDVIEGSWPS
ncbi:thiamine pyrophosphate-binding protein [Rhodococcus sp. (in: high G+C Gram-positive bacteria)]|uniref:thiamine pyrophosphate-binding protein n=1 Tax=Rhodococcus sp. TaxID=1831 RepID=UPI0025798B1A|nr:thiamine pyrophosphate-binding protein [Rhodococcus sp. (in: high G+C Gram-positive bacteria)]MBQ7804039.1 thiamine pyrophosphate-binding protein [Rhodococcus sp. (in: high G+C Gram-positive bacteria)]